MVEGFDSFDEFEAHCLFQAPRIYVRAQVNGRWDSVSFDRLSPTDQNTFIRQWWNEGREPARVVD